MPPTRLQIKAGISIIGVTKPNKDSIAPKVKYGIRQTFEHSFSIFSLISPASILSCKILSSLSFAILRSSAFLLSSDSLCCCLLLFSSASSSFFLLNSSHEQLGCLEESLCCSIFMSAEDFEKDNIIWVASYKDIDGKSHLLEIVCHSLISDSVTFSSTQIRAPRYAATYFFSSVEKEEIVLTAASKDKFKAWTKIVEQSSKATPNLLSSDIIASVFFWWRNPSAFDISNAIFAIAISSD